MAKKMFDSDGNGFYFTFGMHEGEYLSEVPEDYLEWIVENFEDNEDVVELAQEELDKRDDQPRFKK
jgi:hypothetical protein